MVYGKETKGMEKEFKHGLMVVYIKVNGEIIKQMEEENLYIQIKIFMMENGLMISHKDMEYFSIIMVQDIKVIGKMTFNMALVNKYGLTDDIIKVNISKVKNRVKENINGLIILYMMDNGNKIKLKGLENIIGQMENHIKDFG